MAYGIIPDELIEEIRISNDIVDVISDYVRLDKRGVNHFGLCPFHKEKTPSFCVSSTKQIFSCFGCGKGGNVFHFIMNIENLDFIEAVRYLADRAKINLPESEDEGEKERLKLKQEILKINLEAARFFHKELLESEKARFYINQRKLSDTIIKKFGLGYSPESWDILYKHLKDKGFSQDSITKSGLVIPNKNEGYFDRFRGRLIFPIYDVRGNVIAFGGRVTDNSMPKYMNSPETVVYNKGRNLYALNYAKTANEKKILVVEGYMDVISLHQNGIINTVASLGTALTESQGRLLKKYTEEIIISYDADTAGQSAAMRGLDLLSDIGCSVKVLIIPEGKDPDEFIKKKGPENFKKLIENSLSLVEYKIKVLKSTIDTQETEGKIKFLNTTADILAKINNRLERETYIKKLSKEYEISEDAINSEIMRRLKPKGNFKTVVNLGDYKSRAGTSKDTGDKKLDYYEKVVLTLLCIDNSLYKAFKTSLGPGFFSTQENNATWADISERLDKNKDMVIGELLNLLEKETANEYAKIIQEECNFDDNRKALSDYLKKIESIKLEKRQKEILELLGSKSKIIEGDVEKLKLELVSLIQRKKSL